MRQLKSIVCLLVCAMALSACAHDSPVRPSSERPEIPPLPPEIQPVKPDFFDRMWSIFFESSPPPPTQPPEA